MTNKNVNQHLKTGILGEDLACKYLIQKGYKILTRNYKLKWDEIDIVAKTKNNTLIFVEVKTLGSPSELMPEDNMTVAKMRKLRRACETFVFKKPGFIDESKGWRIDLVSIILGDKASGNENVIRHYENI
jgi:putative endonuclease